MATKGDLSTSLKQCVMARKQNTIKIVHWESVFFGPIPKQETTADLTSWKDLLRVATVSASTRPRCGSLCIQRSSDYFIESFLVAFLFVAGLEDVIGWIG